MLSAIGIISHLPFYILIEKLSRSATLIPASPAGRGWLR